LRSMPMVFWEIGHTNTIKEEIHKSKNCTTVD